jgi:hypothetical protein
MLITPAHIRAGSIVLSEIVPSISIGRTVIATVLSAPKAGMVLVSMFGKRLLVETSMQLEKGQVLNLKVHAVSPKVVLKAMPVETAQVASSLKDISTVLSSIVGMPGEKHLSSFLVQEIARQLSAPSGQDTQAAQVAAAVLDQVYQYPNAIAHLLIPLADNDSRSAARVSIEREGEDYVLNFDMETEYLGSLACRARLDRDRGIDVEIRTPSEEIAAFLRENILELKASLRDFGARSVEVVRGPVRAGAPREVNVLV